MRISVLGTGYLGATHAACLAALGHDVVGVDVDAERIRRLQGGRAPFHEPGLEPLLRTGLEHGHLRFATALDEAAEAEVHFLCVGTPQRADGPQADLTALEGLTESLAPLLAQPCLVVGKSTVPVGSAARLRDRLRSLAPGGDRVDLGWNPEFLREGHAVEDSLHPDRLVFGVATGEAFRTLCRLYRPLLDEGIPVVRSDLATAELAKASANLMLAARISLANLLAEVCERAEADVGDLTHILALDHRIGSMPAPGIGYGGGCLPKDSRAFAARARELGVGTSAGLVDAIDRTNLRQRERTVDLAEELVGGNLHGVRVAVLGAAFKADSDDVRDSPALDVAGRLAERGAQVCVHDPQALDNVHRLRPELRTAPSAEEAVRDTDLVLVLTDWDEFASLDPVGLAAVARHPRAIDGRLLLDPEKWRASGWDFHALGRGTCSR